MKVLVTGATGFLGSHLTRQLLKEGHRVRVFCRRTSTFAALAGLEVERCFGDVTDRATLPAAVQNCDWVIHAAADLRYAPNAQERQTMVNVGGSRNIARAAREAGVKRFLHVSSVAAIGISSNPQRPADERFAFNLAHLGWPYHLSKHRAEREVLAEVTLGLDAVIVNPAVICGPSAGGYRIAEPIKKALRSPILPHAPGGLCLVHVQDVVRGVVFALGKGSSGERYILGGSNVSLKEMTDEACSRLALKRLRLPVSSAVAEAKSKATNLSRRIIGKPPLPSYARQFCYQFYDSKRAREELGWEARDFKCILEEFASSGDVSSLDGSDAKFRS